MHTSTKRPLLIRLIAAIIAVIITFLAYNAYEGYGIYKSARQRCTNERTSDEVLIRWLKDDKGFDYDGFVASHRIEQISITSTADGHTIPASYIYAPENSDKNAHTSIMVHGLLGNRLSNYPMSQLFLDLGYNVLTYDQRSSGGNTAPYTTYGFLESYDTIDCVSYLRSQMDKDKTLAVWGQSLGAATVSNAIDEPEFYDNVSYVILDCPLGNAEDVNGRRSFTGRIQLFFTDIFNRVNIGYTFRQQRVIPQIRNTKLPVMVACSTGDHSIPHESQMAVYNSIKNDKKFLYEVSDSNHSDIYFDHPDEYAEKIVEFIDMQK